jgi:hypothetical protein
VDRRAKPHPLQHGQLVAHRRDRLEEIDAFIHCHIKDRGDGFLPEFYLESFPVVALTLADIALDIDVGQKVHLDLDDTVALAGLAPAALYVEGETSRLVTPGTGFRQAREPVPDRREGAGVGGRV